MFYKDCGLTFLLPLRYCYVIWTRYVSTNSQSNGYVPWTKHGSVSHIGTYWGSSIRFRVGFLLWDG